MSALETFLSSGLPHCVSEYSSNRTTTKGPRGAKFEPDRVHHFLCNVRADRDSTTRGCAGHLGKAKQSTGSGKPPLFRPESTPLLASICAREILRSRT
jgi:hypothetical protein